jgi:NCS2 family nucleobase:cation symporter-2
MAKRPAHLIYSVDEPPPLGVTLLLGLQHVFVISVGWIFVVVVVTGIGGTKEQAASAIRMSMIASGIATILQARTKGPVGSGYLCPFSCGPSYLAASLLAGKAGGLPLVFGLTIASGMFEALLSRAMPRLRALLPPEVTGLVVVMVGIELVGLAAPRFLGFSGPGSSLDARPLVVALATLAVMIGPSIWSQGKLRLYPVLLGLGAGYLGSYTLGLLTRQQLGTALAAPLISFPERAQAGWSFSFASLLPFLVASLCSTLKTVGDLTLCQKINDTDWKRTDMKSVSGGILVGAIGSMSSGLFGGIGQSTFSSNVGLSIATGATSRSIALPCGLILIVLAFFPKLAAVFSVMPQPVMGAILVYVASFMILSGIQVITSRMLDTRKTFIVGIPLIFGLSVEMVPGLYAGVPDVLSSLFSSSLSLAAVLVVVLNLLLRIGIAKRQTLELTPGVDDSETIFQFLEKHGSAWGARKEVINRAGAALNEFLESVTTLGLVDGKIAAEVSFDEFNLDIDIRYRGTLMRFPTILPTQAELLHNKKTVADLSGFLIRHYADQVKSDYVDSHCRVQLHFDH